MATLGQMSAPKYADILNWWPTAGSASAANAYTETPGYWRTVQVGGGEGGSVDAQEWVPSSYSIDESTVPEQYRGLVGGHTSGQAGQILMPGQGGGDLPPESRIGDSGTWTANEEYLKSLPNGGMTKFTTPKSAGSTDYGTNAGRPLSILDMYTLGTGDAPDWGKWGNRSALNKSMVYYDPNYGWITPQFNLQPKQTSTDKFAEMLPQLAAAGLSMGFGALDFPALATGMVGAARGIGNGGGWGQAALTALPGMLGAGLGLGGFSLPPQLSQLLNYLRSGYGLYNAAKTRNPIGGAMSLARLSGLGGEG